MPDAMLYRSPLEDLMSSLSHVWDPSLPMPSADTVLALLVAIGSEPDVSRAAWKIIELTEEAARLVDNVLAAGSR